MERAKPLSHKQKAALCRLAGLAWNTCGKAMGFGDVTEFRHACCFDVTGRNGLTECDQLDYIPITNYFHKMLGWPPREDRTPKTALDRALWVLRDALQRWEFTEGYAAAIMRARLRGLAVEGMPLTHLASMLGAEGVRQVTYTVINRGREKYAAATEPHVSRSTLPPGGLQEHFCTTLAGGVQGRGESRARKEVAHA